MKKFVAIDANAIVHRAFHAYPATLSTSDGLQVNAVYGFTSMLLSVLDEFGPEYIICAFDTGKPTFRHEQYVEYKAHRKPVDKSLISQFPLVEEVLNAFNIPILKKHGFEADDILGTIASYAKEGKWRDEDLEVIIVTGDRDLLQLVGGNVKICLPEGSFKTIRVFNAQEVHEKYGFKPEQVIDYKAIVGDASDNIPGIKGIGDKTAKDLLAKYGSLEEIYKNMADIKPRYQRLFTEGVEQGQLSKELATIKCDVDMNIELDACVMRSFNKSDVIDILVKYEFRSLIPKLPVSIDEEFEKKNGVEGQLDMFGNFSGPITDVDEISGTKAKDLASVDNLESMLEKSSEILIVYLEGVAKGQEELLFLRTINKKGENVDLFLKNDTQIMKKLLVGLKENPFERIVTFGWEEFVSRATDVEQEVLVDGEFPKVFDIKLLAFLLTSGLREYTIQTVAFEFLKSIVPETISEYNATQILDLADNLYRLLEGEVKNLQHSEYVVRNMDNVNMYKKYETNLISTNSLYNVEIPTSVIISDMENRGVVMDMEYLEQLREDLMNDIDKVQKDVFHFVGHEFNLDSPKQLSDVLYGELELTPQKKGKTFYSTNEDVLHSLEAASPVVANVLEYRMLRKLLTTYIEPFYASMSECKRKGLPTVVHTDFRQTGASSGRFSSINPNMQNLPARGDWAPKVRKLFKAREGFEMVSIDYSQIEFRLMADISGDQHVIDDFIKGKDIHRAAAARTFNKKEEDVTSEERAKGKTINFGILYGQTGFGLSKQLGIPVSEATEYIKEYFQEYKGIEKYLHEAAELAAQRGWVESLLGRRRYIAGLKSENRMVRQAAIREAINMPIQGSAADLMKMSMVKLNNVIGQKYKGKAFFLLQIHDEFVLEIANGIREEFCEEAKHIMENVVKLRVPLVAEVSFGQDMAELK